MPFRGWLCPRPMQQISPQYFRRNWSVESWPCSVRQPTWCWRWREAGSHHHRSSSWQVALVGIFLHRALSVWMQLTLHPRYPLILRQWSGQPGRGTHSQRAGQTEENIIIFFSGWAILIWSSCTYLQTKSISEPLLVRGNYIRNSRMLSQNMVELAAYYWIYLATGKNARCLIWNSIQPHTEWWLLKAGKHFCECLRPHCLHVGGGIFKSLELSGDYQRWRMQG